MTDIEQIQTQYKKMYDAMIRKDEAALVSVLDDSFVLVHMTGMRQSKAAFLCAVTDGTLNYFSARHENMIEAVKETRERLRHHLDEYPVRGGEGSILNR